MIGWSHDTESTIPNARFSNKPQRPRGRWVLFQDSGGILMVALYLDSLAVRGEASLYQQPALRISVYFRMACIQTPLPRFIYLLECLTEYSI